MYDNYSIVECEKIRRGGGPYNYEYSIIYTLELLRIVITLLGNFSSRRDFFFPGGVATYSRVEFVRVRVSVTLFQTLRIYLRLFKCQLNWDGCYIKTGTNFDPQLFIPKFPPKRMIRRSPKISLVYKVISKYSLNSFLQRFFCTCSQLDHIHGIKAGKKVGIRKQQEYPS